MRSASAGSARSAHHRAGGVRLQRPERQVLAVLARRRDERERRGAGARREQHDGRAARRAAQQVLEPFAARLVGPLQVVEREQQRSVAGDVLEHRAQRPVVAEALAR